MRQNANVKIKPNLTKHYLCRWINKDLLPNEILNLAFLTTFLSKRQENGPINKLKFEVLSADKGMVFDGHERDDIVKERRRVSGQDGCS